MRVDAGVPFLLLFFFPPSQRPDENDSDKIPHLLLVLDYETFLSFFSLHEKERRPALFLL